MPITKIEYAPLRRTDAPEFAVSSTRPVLIHFDSGNCCILAAHAAPEESGTGVMLVAFLCEWANHPPAQSDLAELEALASELVQPVGTLKIADRCSFGSYQQAKDSAARFLAQTPYGKRGEA